MSFERVVQLIELEPILCMYMIETHATSDLFSLKLFIDAFVTCYEVLHYSQKKNTSLPGQFLMFQGYHNSSLHCIYHLLIEYTLYVVFF